MLYTFACKQTASIYLVAKADGTTDIGRIYVQKSTLLGQYVTSELIIFNIG